MVLELHSSLEVAVDAVVAEHVRLNRHRD
jgi:hypothetical protein